MEGDGGGMVAIVQGLQDAGLAVTVVNTRHQDEKLLSATKYKRFSKVKNSAENSTQVQTMNNSSAQICDGRYASSYQLAHCSLRPSSPPVHFPEFPLQRPEPCRTQGNFEIGCDSCTVEDHSPKPSIHCYRNSFIWNDRGLQSSTSRTTDLFAVSLRKYPSIPPDRTPSADLINKLLVFTQAKNSSKSSKSMRCLIKGKLGETTNEKNIDNASASSKQTPAYLKIKPDHKDGVSVANEANLNRFKEKRIKVHSITNERRSIKYKDNHINETYDYLKSTSPRRYAGRPTEVRYLDDVTRCLKETIRQLCDEGPVACQQMQNRYSQHRRQHHRRSSAQQSGIELNNGEAQASMPFASKRAMMASFDSPGTSMQTSPTNPTICCFCRRPVPCACKIVQQGRTSIQDDTRQKLEEQIFQWLKDVPVYADITPNDKAKRGEIIENLVNTLTQLTNDDNFENKAKVEINKCLDELPMWRPTTKTDQDLFKNQFADGLLQKLNKIKVGPSNFKEEITKWLDEIPLKSRDDAGQVVNKQKIVDKMVNELQSLTVNRPADNSDYNESLKNEIVNILENLPIEIDENKDSVINNLAQKLVNKLNMIPNIKTLKNKVNRVSANLLNEFDKEILDWLNGIPELSEGSSHIVNENKKFAGELAKNLTQLQYRGNDDEEIQEQMQKDIFNWLDSAFERQNGRIEYKTKNKLTEKLMKKLIKAAKFSPRTRFPRSTLDENQDEYIQLISDWLIDIPELLSNNELENKKMVEILAAKLQETESRDNENEIHKEILNWLLAESKKKETEINPNSQENLIRKLMNKINRIPKSNRGSSQNMKERLIKDIREWLECEPKMNGFSQNTKMIEQLANQMLELREQGDDEMIHDGTQDAIMFWIDNLIENSDVKFDPRKRKTFAKKLENKVKTIPKARKRWSKQEDLTKLIQEEIANIINKSPLKLSNKRLIHLQSEISNLFCKNIDKVKSFQTDEIQTKLIDLLEIETNLSIEDAEMLANILINKIETMPWSGLPEYSGISKSRSPSLCISDIKKSVREEVNDALDIIKVSNRDQLESKLTDLLTNRIMHNRDSNELSEQMHSVLHDANLTPEQVEIVYDKLINRAKEISLVAKSNDSKNLFTPSQKGWYQSDETEREILDFVEEVTGDNSVQSNKTIKEAAAKLYEKVHNIVSDNNKTELEKDKLLRNAVTKFLKSISLPEQEYVAELTSRLQNDFKTSTRRASKGPTFSFHPTRAGLSSISSIEFENSHGSQNQEEENFISDLMNTIQDWIEKLDVDILENQPHKYSLAKELATHIANRQKYLQINPNVKTSDEEELEHLKYQVFRWLNKIMDIDDLAPIMTQTDTLMSEIKKIAIPDLIKSIGKKQQTRAALRQMPNLHALQDEISRWLENLPPNLISRNANQQQEIVNELANKLQQVIETDSNIDENVENEIYKWLPKLIKEPNKSNIKMLAASLKSNLLDKRFAGHSSWLLEQNEYLESKLEEWAQSLPINVQASLNQDQLQKIKAFILNLKQLIQQTIFSEDINLEQRVKEETDKFLQTYSTGTSIKKDLKLDADDIGTVLQNTPKECSRPFEHDSSKTFDENLTSVILEWLKKLSVYHQSTPQGKFTQEQLISDFNNEQKMTEDLQHRLAEQLPDFFNSFLISQNTDEQFLQCPDEYLELNIKDWIQSLPLNVRESLHQEQLKKIKEDLILNLKIFYQQYQSSKDTNFKQKITEEINKFLHTYPIDTIKKRNAEFIMDKVDSLVENSQDIPSQMKDNTPVIDTDLLKNVIEDWLKQLPLQTGKTQQDISNELTEFTKNIAEISTNVHAKTFDSNTDYLRNEILKFLQKIPLEIDTKSPQALEDFINQLLNAIKGKLSKITQSERSNLSSKSVTKKAADILFEGIETWCENLPIRMGDVPEEKEQVKAVKQNIAKRLMKKIGEINMNPEIFNDDFLYGDIIQDEIDNLLSALPLTPELDGNKAALNNELVGQIKQAKQKAKDELAGQAYKKDLRDTLENTLPFTDLTSDEQAAFDALKDNVADAYIDMHFMPDDRKKSKFKENIASEIDRFCDDYLKRHPATPLNRTKINQDLYSALKKVPVPKDESIRPEIEQIRIKGVINDWTKELPMAEVSGPERMQRNKIITVVAKRLYEIENDKEINPHVDDKDKIKSEISKLLKKLPLKPGVAVDVVEMAQKLMDKLEKSKKSRRISSSTKSLSLEESEVNDESRCNSISLSRLAPSFPQSNLNSEDRKHLQKIRERIRKPSRIRITASCECRDASVNPLPVDAASQTDIRVQSAVHTDVPNIPTPSSGPTTDCLDFSPRVIVKEYFWDSCSSKLQESVFELPQTTQVPCSPGPSYMQTPFSQRSSYGTSLRPMPQMFSANGALQRSQTSQDPCMISRHQLITQIENPSSVTRPEGACPSIHDESSPSQVVSQSRQFDQPPVNSPPFMTSKPSCQTHEIPICSTPRRPYPILEKTSALRQPCFKSKESDECFPEIGTSRSFRNQEHVSTTDNIETNNCAGLPSNTKMSKGLSPEDSGFYPGRSEEIEYWDHSCPRRKIYRIPSQNLDSLTIHDRERIPDKLRYKYRGLTPPKCSSRWKSPRRVHHSNCQSCESLKYCSKCCGIACPHPSNFYFS